MKILMLSSTFPYPPTRGGTQNRTFNLLKYLASNHEITLITRPTPDVTSEEIEQLRTWVDNLRVFPVSHPLKTGIFGKIGRFSEFLWKGTPPNVQSLYSLPMQDAIDELLEGDSIDVITCEHSVNEIFIRPTWQEKVKTVVNIHSSVYRTCKNQIETGISKNPYRDRLYLPLIERYERRFCQKFTELVVTTVEDKAQIEALESSRAVSVIPNGVDLEMFPYRSTDPGGHHLMITGGMDYGANIDSACYFASEIFPILQKKYPSSTLTIVGSNPAPAVIELANNPSIVVTGRVPSMAQYLHRATVCVVPMRAGFGMKIKTLEAMAAGAPVVASDHGLEGMEVDSCALRANQVNEYLEAVSRLFDNSELRKTLSLNARKLIEKNYTWEQASSQYEKILTGYFN